MSPAPAPPAASHPRWDGRRVLFSIEDGDRSVDCAISLTALQDLSEQRRFKPAELLLCFARARGRIEAIALGKLRTRAGNRQGLLHIWSDDIDDPPPASAPVAARHPAPPEHITTQQGRTAWPRVRNAATAR